jgi:transcriptional regulator with XRE-family HTH domain
MDDLKTIIAKNITELRRSSGLTQAELATRLNYSDKAVSKWERGESIPDVAILKRIADLFGVTVDYLLAPEHQEKDKSGLFAKVRRHNHLVIALLSTALVFLIATFIFVFMGLYFVSITKQVWLVYIYAVPAACVVLLIFNTLWGRRKLNYIIISLLVWSILAGIYLTFISSNMIWMVFLPGIPAQIIILLWSSLKPRKHQIKEKTTV